MKGVENQECRNPDSAEDRLHADETVDVIDFFVDLKLTHSSFFLSCNSLVGCFFVGSCVNSYDISLGPR